jgi:hypothetical protein
MVSSDAMIIPISERAIAAASRIRADGKSWTPASNLACLLHVTLGAELRIERL